MRCSARVVARSTRLLPSPVLRCLSRPFALSAYRVLRFASCFVSGVCNWACFAPKRFRVRLWTCLDAVNRAIPSGPEARELGSVPTEYAPDFPLSGPPALRFGVR